MKTVNQLLTKMPFFVHVSLTLFIYNFLKSKNQHEETS